MRNSEEKVKNDLVEKQDKKENDGGNKPLENAIDNGDGEKPDKPTEEANQNENKGEKVNAEVPKKE